MKEFMLIAKALGDENRVRVLMCLQRRELCVCQLISLLGLAPSTVSKHISILYRAGLVESRKKGRWVYYRLPEKSSGAAPIMPTIAWLKQCLDKAPAVAEDRKRLKTICAMDARALCKVTLRPGIRRAHDSP